jgi:exopolysaccharide biosynthesis protein
MGQNKEGDIVIVASKTLGITTIEEIINVGLEYGMIDGILFDGGTSVEYTLKDGKHLTSFKALSDVSKVVVGIDRPMTYIYGNFK